MFINNANGQSCGSTGAAPFVSAGPVGAATAITQNSASVSTQYNGWTGGAFPMTVYVEWGTASGGPYPNNTSFTQNNWFDNALPGTFNANLTGLLSNTTYYYRVRVVGATGTCSTPQQNFTTTGPFTITTTAASSITTNSASSGGSVTPSGAVTITAKGVVWGTSTAPSLPTTNKTIDGGTASGAFTSSLTGLIPGTTYYYRAYVSGNDGNTYYGPELSFTTTAAFTITTTAPSGVAATKATTGGNITALGAITVTTRGVAYGTAPNPTTAGTKTNDGSGPGAFVSNLTGLSGLTLYYVRAYVIGSDGNTYYGPQQTFTTSFLPVGTVAPFSLTPKWFFGNNAGYSFPSGSFPAVPPSASVPTILTVSSSGASPETSMSISFRNGNTALYSNSMQAWNGGGTSVRSFAGEGTCAGSSTGGGVVFPDPANDATNDAFYMIVSNDITGGSCASATGPGTNSYRFTGTGNSVVYNSGPNKIAANTFATEAIAAGGDGTGGYWVVVHDQAANNRFRVWRYTASGISAPVDYTPATTAAITTTMSAGYLKFSPCMDMIAFAGFVSTANGSNSEITVYSFDKATGAIGPQIARKSGAGVSGLEFSPDGKRIYHNYQGGPVNWFLISNPATTGSVTGATASWTIQMGPDGQIYTSGAGGTSVGKITSPNDPLTPGYTAMTLNATTSTFRGLNNLAWLNPQGPVVTATNVSGCNRYLFKETFVNYFNDSIGVSKIEWDFNNDGVFETTKTGAAIRDTAFWTYPSIAGTVNYTARVRITDVYCNTVWTGTVPVAVTCPTTMPIELLSFTGKAFDNKVVLNWQTVQEINNAYFLVQRSTDGFDFVTIGNVKGNGTSSTINNYVYTDAEPINGLSYYRLVQVDYDGTAKNTNVISMNLVKASISISPNPFNGEFNLDLTGISEDVEVVIFDVLGRQVSHTTADTETRTIQLGADLAKGAYIVTVVGVNVNIREKIIKD